MTAWITRRVVRLEAMRLSAARCGTTLALRETQARCALAKNVHLCIESVRLGVSFQRSAFSKRDKFNSGLRLKTEG